MSAYSDNFKNLLRSVETEIAKYYAFDLSASAVDHLISKSELITQMGKDSASKSQVVLSQTSMDEAFIGIFFEEEFVHSSACQSIESKLSKENLNTFCVLVEEISHFHLLINRLTNDLNVSHLELEWQGEIDKLLLSARWLEMQSGDAHWVPLARQIFDYAEFLEGTDASVYEEANRLAAQFWFSYLRLENVDSLKTYDPKLRRILRNLYRGGISEKFGTATLRIAG